VVEIGEVIAGRFNVLTETGFSHQPVSPLKRAEENYRDRNHALKSVAMTKQKNFVHFVLSVHKERAETTKRHEPTRNRNRTKTKKPAITRGLSF